MHFKSLSNYYQHHTATKINASASYQEIGSYESLEFLLLMIRKVKNDEISIMRMSYVQTVLLYVKQGDQADDFECTEQINKTKRLFIVL